MVEAAALERTLREHPDDEAAWMVYGDWLLEHGDVRGALIQLEHRHARTRAAERAALRGEIDALVKQHQRRWSRAVPKGVAVEQWKHGFPTKIAVTWDERAPARIERALRERFVSALWIGAPEEAEDGEDEYDDDGEPVPAPLVEIGALAAIDLSALVELDLAYVNVGAPGAEAIAASATLGRLEVLDLRYCGIGDRGALALAKAPTLGALRQLRLQRNELTGTGARALQRFERLVELDLRYNDLGVDGARALLEAPLIGRLARLELYRADVSDRGVQELASSSRLPPALRSYWRSV
jgi:uncharacterized protein (TIGR02996 family)